MKKIFKILAYIASCFVAFGMGLATGFLRSFKRNGIEIPERVDAELTEAEDYIVEKFNEEDEPSDDTTEVED